MDRLPDHAIVMHPGPMIRGMEIGDSVADHDRSVIVEQVANGVSVRMAVLYLLVGGSRQAARARSHRRRRRDRERYLLAGVRPLGGDPVDLVIEGGRIAAIDPVGAPPPTARVGAGPVRG